MIRFLRRQWFLACLALVLVIGSAFPRELEPIYRHAPRDAIVAVVLFLMALPLEFRSMWATLRRPGPALLAIGINSLLVPPLAWLAGRPLLDELATGLVIAAAIPCTLASAAVWTRRAGGNDALAILVTMVTNLTCFVVTPLWLRWLTSTDVRMDAPAMAKQLLWQVVLPIVLAQGLRLWRPLGDWASRHKIGLSALAQIGILSMIGLGAIASGLRLAETDVASGIGWLDWLAMLVAVVGVHLAALGLGHLLGHWAGMSRGDRIAIGFAGSQKTLMVGLALGLKYYSGLTILPMVAYHVCQLLADTLIADRLRDRHDERASRRESLP